MSSKYKFVDPEGIYFTTSTVVDWIDVFTRDLYREIVLDSIRFCQAKQGLQLHAWVLMTNHLHMVCSFIDGYAPGKVLRNMKSFTAIHVIDAIINNPHESRKKWMLDLFEKHGTASKANFRFKFWQDENHPILLSTNDMLTQRMDYLHSNPERAGFVEKPEDWRFSSAIDYYTENGKGLLDLVRLD